MPCRVCGEPKTVSSHLMPRAFAMDARRGEKHLMVGTTDSAGYRITQGGHFDNDILCEKHERALEQLDDYGVDFVRSFPTRHEKREMEGRSFWVLRGIESDRLVRFAASVIWRWSVSSQPATSGIWLGAQTITFRRAVFEGANVGGEPALGFYSMRSRELAPETVSGMVLPPTAMRPFGIRHFGFGVGGLIFVVKADVRAVPPEEALLKVNGRTDYVGESRFVEDGPEWPAIRTMILNMGAHRRSPGRVEA